MDTAFYCVHDGAVLRPANESVQLYRDKVKCCSNCSIENSFDYTYCCSCGHSLEKIKDQTEEKLKMPVFKTNLAKGMSLSQASRGFIGKLLDIPTIMQNMIYVGISIVAIFVISFILSLGVNRFIFDALGGELSPFIDEIKLVSMTDIFMLSHMGGVNYTANLMIFEGGLKTSSGIFILLLIPAIILAIIGYVIHRKYAAEAMIERLARCFSFAILYGVIVGAISLFSGISVQMSDPTGFLDGGITISASYSFLESMFNAICISFIFTVIGAMFSTIKGQSLPNVQYGVSISYAIRHTMIGLFAMWLIGAFMIYSSTEISSEVRDAEARAFLGTQLGGYLWNVAQFGSAEFVVSSFGEKSEASYSLIGGPKASRDEEGFKEIFEEVPGTIWLLTLAPILLHYWAARKLYQVSQGNILYELGAYAVIFGLANAVIVSIFKLSVETSFGNMANFTFGFSQVGTFFLSTISAMLVSYVTVMLKQRQQPSQQFEQSQSA